jgi:membrane-associated protein
VTGLVDAALDGLGQLPLWAVLVAVWVVMALETTMLVGLVVPGDLVVLFAASTVDTPIEFVLVVAAVTLGSLAGETVGYGVGRRWGPRVRASRAGRRLGEERWRRAADYLERRGGRAVFVARYLAAIHALTPIVAGTVGMRYRRFIAWCAAGALTWSALYVTLGAVAGASYRHYADGLGTATSVAAGGLVGAGAFVGAVSLHRRSKRRDLIRLPFGLTARDLLLVVTLAVVVALATGAAQEPGSRAPDATAYAIAVAGVLALLGRRRWPLPVLAATVGAFGAYHLLDYPAGPPLLAVAIAVYSTAGAGHLSPALTAAGLVTGSGLVYRWLVEGDNVLGVETTLGAAFLVTVALLGDTARSRPPRHDAGTGHRDCSGGTAMVLIGDQAALAAESLDRQPAGTREALRLRHDLSQSAQPNLRPGNPTLLTTAVIAIHADPRVSPSRTPLRVLTNVGTFGASGEVAFFRARRTPPWSSSLPTRCSPSSRLTPARR